ncbi:hypothetical protein C4J81_05675 [Deltaproteobacteria bacterium Smac51]|nr:hypothetical protein C4J81_05675 [Deltaproteobacteria bacterium Smac51]
MTAVLEKCFCPAPVPGVFSHRSRSKTFLQDGCLVGFFKGWKVYTDQVGAGTKTIPGFRRVSGYLKICIITAAGLEEQ